MTNILYCFTCETFPCTRCITQIHYNNTNFVFFHLVNIRVYDDDNDDDGVRKTLSQNNGNKTNLLATALAGRYLAIKTGSL